MIKTFKKLFGMVFELLSVILHDKACFGIRRFVSFSKIAVSSIFKYTVQ